MRPGPWIVVALLAAVHGDLRGQGDDARVVATRPVSVMLHAGMGTPLSHAGLTDLWGSGPSVSAAMLVGVRRGVSIGLGLDAMLLPFNSEAFAARYPGIPVQARSLGFLHLHVLVRLTALPGARFSPFLTMTLGAARCTGAVDREVVNDVRVIYYEIPGRMRLAAGLAGGAGFFLVRGFALEAEVRGTYLHHDAEAGLFAFLRLGFRLTV